MPAFATAQQSAQQATHSEAYVSFGTAEPSTEWTAQFTAHMSAH